jgi:hypothetical protein
MFEHSDLIGVLVMMWIACDKIESVVGFDFSSYIVFFIHRDILFVDIYNKRYVLKKARTYFLVYK